MLSLFNLIANNPKKDGTRGLVGFHYSNFVGDVRVFLVSSGELISKRSVRPKCNSSVFLSNDGAIGNAARGGPESFGLGEF